MTIIFDLKPGSVRTSTNPPRWEATYVCKGMFGSDLANSYAKSMTSPMIAVHGNILYRNDIELVERGYRVWDARVTYEATKRGIGEYGFDFSTVGGSFHITHSKETVKNYPESAGHNQAINVRKNGQDIEVQGETIVIPAMRMTYRIRNPAGVLNESFARGIFRITGCVNSDTWHGCQPGELLFLGGEGSDGTVAEAEMAYHMAYETNLRGLVIGAIEDIKKDGHDLLWVYWKNDEGDDEARKKPQSVHVERVYNRIKFAEKFTF